MKVTISNTLLTLTSSDLVKLLVLTFCFLDLEAKTLVPNEIVLSIWHTYKIFLIILLYITTIVLFGKLSSRKAILRRRYEKRTVYKIDSIKTSRKSMQKRIHNNHSIDNTRDTKRKRDES